MDIAQSIHTEVTSLSFSFLTSKDIRDISVKQIDNPLLFDSLNLPNRGGLYDAALGPLTSRDVCETCKQSYFACPGHFGHIDIPMPVYHPLFMREAFILLRTLCMYCHQFKYPELVVRQYLARIRLLDAGFLEEAQDVASRVAQSVEMAQNGEEGMDVDEQQGEAGPSKKKRNSENVAALMVRIDDFVQHKLAEAQRHGKAASSYKDGLVFEERRRTIREFLGLMKPNRCQRCRAHAFTFRKEKSVKIVELDLDAKKKIANTMAGFKRPDILRTSNLTRVTKHKKPPSVIDEGIEMSSSSGSDEESEPVEDIPEGEEQNEMELPRAANGQLKGAKGRNERVLAAVEVREHLRLLFKKEKDMCQVLFGRHGSLAPTATSPQALADMFFLDVLPVPPSRFRPPARMGEDLYEAAQNSLLSAVLTTTSRLRDLNQRLIDLRKAEDGKIVLEKEEQLDASVIFSMLLEALVKLQHDVNSFIDSSKNPTVMRQGKLPPPGVKQLLEKKEGLFRKHMMGKRVNYAARSVISPDVNVETNEIGVPPVFAKKLTYPEPVTPQNVHYLRQLVINGPHNHPGASLVQNEDGSQISLDRTTIEQRTAIASQLLTAQGDDFTGSLGPAAKGKKVYRHLRDGDIVILNRQPTLHKPSMMCHRVKVLLGEKTIRMHYANCNSYNADFDGDEMNIHFPQNEVARAEAEMIANTDNQYLVPTSGKPLRGLIQDHVVAGVWICSKSTFFTREQYFQLIYGALRTEDNYSGEGRIRTLPPAIFKPKPMWTGKQVFSTLLANLTPSNAKGLNLVGGNKIANKLWGRDDGADPNMSESTTIFFDGHLICGVLDKSQYGASDFGLVHGVHELYGPMIANRLLGVLSRLLTKYLQNDAFSCRMDDLLLTGNGESMRKDILEKAADSGTKTAMKFVGLPDDAKVDDPEDVKNLAIRLEEILRDDSLMAGLDGAMQATFNKTTSEINNQVLPKHLVKLFPDNNMQMMTISGAKGSAVNASQISTLLGQQALEGRRVPTMVSGKTLPSFKAFDTSARSGGYVANRFLTGIRPQEYYFHCMAGREGLIDTAVKTSRSGYLQRCLIKHLEGVKVHYDHTVRDSDSSVLQFYYGEDSLDVTRQTYLNSFDFAARNLESLVNRYRPGDTQGKIVTDEAISHMKRALKKPAKTEPVMSLYSPSRYFGSMSETYAKRLRDHIEANKLGYIAKKGEKAALDGKIDPYRKIKVSERDFLDLARVRFMRGLVDPGEAVGLLTAQGVGEPSTQMTLNTFHLAGHGAANVTLGIPRLREIVMTASKNPTTPTMKLALREGVSEKDCEVFVKHVSRLTLSQVIDKITVTEQLSAKGMEDERLRKYTVLIELYPQAEYIKEYEITSTQVHEALAFSLSKWLSEEIKKEIKNVQKTIQQDLAVGQGIRVRGNDLEEDEVEEEAGLGGRRGKDDELENDDGDSGELKRAKQAMAHEYEDDDADSGIADLEDYVERMGNEDEGAEGDEEGLGLTAADKAKMDLLADKLSEAFKASCKYATGFSFDLHGGKSAQIDLEFAANAPKLLLVDVIERACRKSVIHEISRIGRCMKIFDDKGIFSNSLITEGSNLQGMWSLADELVDLDRLASNDVYAILTTYGVEAARRAVIDEVSAVFGVYGIAVNYRHLTIIADYMTHLGGYRAFNRTDISNKSSPLLKASFETTVQFLSDAVLHGDFDDLTSPAAKIIMGQPSLTGTGSFDIRAPNRS